MMYLSELASVTIMFRPRSYFLMYSRPTTNPLFKPTQNHEIPRALTTLCKYARLSNFGHGGFYNRQRLLRIVQIRTCLQQNFSLSPYSAPFVFIGLTIVLWTYKCLALIIFQSKIIYMPSVPPFSRKAKICDYSNSCLPVLWSEANIKAADGTKLSLAIGMHGDDQKKSSCQRVVLAYFQGNAGSLPSRLPLLSENLLRIRSCLRNYHPVVVALSYRGFWSSSGRPTQQGIEQDSAAFLAWLLSDYAVESPLVLWGQSIGSGIMTNAVAQFLYRNKRWDVGQRRIKGLILETPFTSIREMLRSVYPQKFLPYRYLWPFLTSQWDTEAALRNIHRSIHYERSNQPGMVTHGEVHKLNPEILILQAEKDELVPESHAQHLAHLCSKLGLTHKLHIVPDSLHTESSTKRNGQEQISLFAKSCFGE